MSRSSPKYRLLERFQNVFQGTRYKHRDSSIGDSIAIEFYEDLHNFETYGMRPRLCYQVYSFRTSAIRVRAAAVVCPRIFMPLRPLIAWFDADSGLRRRASY